MLQNLYIEDGKEKRRPGEEESRRGGEEERRSVGPPGAALHRASHLSARTAKFLLS